MAKIKISINKEKIVNLLKRNWILILVLLVGAIFRLYKINEYMTFLGDEGRDVIVVRNLLKFGDPILIGPGTSVGGMYLGPIYYYFMAPFLFLANYSPVGPAVAVALLGVATIYFVYLAGKKWFSEKVGIIASILYAISPTVIQYSRSSWNPNIMPFFALLSVYSIWKVYKENKFRWLIVTAVAMAFVMQSHYLGILLAPTLFIYWLISYLKNRKNNKDLARYTIYAVLIFVFLMSPLAIFDLRHDYMNTKALYKFLTVRQETVSARPWSAVPKMYPILTEINTSLLTAKELISGKIVTALFVVFTAWQVFSKRKRILDENILLVILWMAFGLIGFGIYKQHIYDHYFGFLFVAPFLITSLFFEKIISVNGKLKILGYLLLVSLIGLNLYKNPLRFHPNRQLQRSVHVAEKIIDESDGKRFNLAVLAERNYEDGYRYFLEVKGAEVLHADRWDKNTISDTLFVACEMPKEKCDPTHSPKAEVANFGWTKIAEEWEVDGVIIYKLVHTQ